MANEWIRKAFKGDVRRTALASGISAGAMSVTVVDGSSYPTGADAPFVIAIDRGLANEEKLLISSRTGNTLTVLERGYDDTTAATHSVAAVVAHVLDSNSIDQVNAAISEMIDAGGMLVRTADGFAQIAPGNPGEILTWDGGTDLPVWDAANVDVQVYLASNTWTKPSWALSTSLVHWNVIAPGGGGGSGPKQPSGSAVSGGAGGGGGERVTGTALASAFSATEAITVGAAGTGGAAVTTNSTNGNAGTNAGNCSIGTKVVARGGKGGEGGGTGQPGAAGGAGGAVIGGTGQSADPGTVGGSGGAGWDGWAGGGGCGGPRDTGNATYEGGSGGSTGPAAGGAAATLDNTAGANGTSVAANSGQTGGGGGGGRGSGKGGNGGAYGAGGAGGGPGLNSVVNSGAGGDGGAGIVIIITYR